MEKKPRQVREKLYGREERCADKSFSSNWLEFYQIAKPWLCRMSCTQRAALQAHCVFCLQQCICSQHKRLILGGEVVKRQHPFPCNIDTLIVFPCCAYISHSFLGWPMHICVSLFTQQTCRWMFCPQRPQMLWAPVVLGGGTPQCPKMILFKGNSEKKMHNSPWTLQMIQRLWL